MKEETKVLEYLEFYKKMLDLQMKHISEKYENFLKGFTESEIAEVYKTFYCKTKLRKSYVYFIYNKYTSLTKIGVSDNPIQRYKSIVSNFKTNFGFDNGLELLGIKFIPSGKKEQVEKLYHKKFAKYRKHGEWFELSKDYILTEVMIGSMYCGFKIDFDTDGLLYNEGFLDRIEFYMPTSSELCVFALDSLDSYTKRIANDDIQGALIIKKFVVDNICVEYGYSNFGFLGRDVRSFNSPFSSSSKNSTWEIFKWLYDHNDKYALSSQKRINIETGEIYRKVVGFGEHCKVLSSSELIEEYVINDIITNKN